MNSQSSIANRQSSIILRILLIEDNPEDTLTIRRMLKKTKTQVFHLECASQLSEGLKRLGRGTMAFA